MQYSWQMYLYDCTFFLIGYSIATVDSIFSLSANGGAVAGPLFGPKTKKDLKSDYFQYFLVRTVRRWRR